MLKLLVSSSSSFLWRADPGQWLLRPDPGGETAALVRETPFVIGRSPDCQLVLPDSPEFRKTTSRWHCHIAEEKKRPVIVDGSLSEVPETGGRKPSVSGTFVNGSQLTGPRRLRAGDEIGIGPWRMGVEEFKESPVGIDAALATLGDTTPRLLAPRDPRLDQGFARLHGLSIQLNRSADVEANLVAILNCAMTEMPCAGVAALLVDGAEGRCQSRIAWQRGVGRVFDLRFSSGLVRRLARDRSFLFDAKLKERTKSQSWEKIGSALLVPLWGPEERLGILYMDNRGCHASFTETDLFLASALASHASLQLLIERQSFLARVESSMSRYFGPDVVRLIVEQARIGRPVLPEVRERMATIIFVDLEGFSAFCRDRPPRQISELLNPFLQLATECIQRHSGHVDKFIGDGVLGVFGARPLDDDPGGGGHATQAVRAARQLISGWVGRSTMFKKMSLSLRAGINTGPVVIGNIGFPGRMEYSVIGEAVNLASRMEKLARPNGIAMTDATKRLLGDEFPCVDGGEASVKGFSGLRVWRLGA